MMSQRYPNKHWARHFDPAHLRNHVDWLLGDSVAQLKAVTATGQESVSPAWPVVLRFELELRKEAMKLMNMSSVTIAEALSAARHSDELRTCFLITPLALGGGQKQEQETRRDRWCADETKTEAANPEAATQSQWEKAAAEPLNSMRDSKRQKVAEVSRRGSTRYGRVKKDNPTMLHSRHNGKAASPSPFRTLRVAVPESRVNSSTFVRIVFGPTALTSVDHSMKLVPPT